MVKSNSFYSKLQTTKGLDKRDNRGKRHDLAIILTGLTIALFSKRDGNLSSIQRHMKHNYKKLCKSIQATPRSVISRSQLPVVLCQVDIDIFEGVLFDFFEIRLTDEEKRWFSADGKELRGSIEKGHKRGEAIVQVVEQATGCIVAQGFYNGRKESEKPAIQHILVEKGLLSQKISFDALHFAPSLLDAIEDKKGVYLVGLKDNQKELLADMAQVPTYLKPIYSYQTVEKGHGRIDQRQYELFDVRKEYFDARWKKSNLSCLVKVSRQRLHLKTGKTESETAYYMSNELPENQMLGKDLCHATRKHWSVETTNHLRDVTLNEDKFRTKKTIVRK